MRYQIKNKAVLLLLLVSTVLGARAHLTAQENALRFSITDVTVTEKDTFTVAIKADSLLTGKGVFAYRFELTYSTYYFEFIGVDGVSTLLNGWGLPEINGAVPGRVKLAGAGASPLAGSGDLIYLKFRAVVRFGDWLRFDQNNSYLNEGDEELLFTDTHIQINQLSLPNISPDSRTLFVGEETQLSVSGGTPPYTFSVVDTSVAVITEQTKVRAKAPGFTKIMVEDANGETDLTSGNFEVRSVQLSFEPISAWPGDTFYLPVKITVDPGTNLVSGAFELTHNANVTGLKEWVQQGDFNISLQRNASGTSTKVSFATATGFTGSGILCYVPFVGNASGNHYLTFANARFNEKLNAFVTNGYVTINALPTLSFSPNSATLMWGETRKVTVGNGTAPYALSVSNTAVAEIDAQGNLTGKSGGSVTVTAVDDHGATNTSGIFTINDNRFSIDNTSGVLNSTTKVPISTSALPAGKSVFGFTGTVRYNPDKVEFKGVEGGNEGMLMEVTAQGNTLNFAGATSTGITSGIVCYLLFEIKATMALQEETPLTLLSMTGNEGQLISARANGNVKRTEQTSYPPVANAGSNFSVNEGEQAQLDGSDSYDEDNDPLTYVWTAPQGITLSDNTAQKPLFTAPEVNANTNYEFTLVVNDGSDDSDPSTVTVTVVQVNKKPVAVAGEDASYPEGSSIKLDGKASFDEDGDPVSYTWTSLDGIILFDRTSPTPSFIAPQVNEDTPVRFVLVVNDGVLNSDADTVTITIAQLNKKPVAFAGGDMNVNEGEMVELDGTLSSDVDGDPLTYLWTAPAGIPLSSTSQAKPTFTAPTVVLDSVIRFTLVVNDGILDSDPDEILVTVHNLDTLSSAALIEAVTLTNLESYSIDTVTNSVELTLPYGYDISGLNPVFTFSEGAKISPANGSIRNFTLPQTYTLTAEDGKTKRVWTVSVNRKQETFTRTLVEGWNWISLNVTPDSPALTDLFSGTQNTEQDYLKSVTASSVFYTSGGWFGDLINFPASQMVKYHRENSGSLEVTGTLVNPTVQKIPIVTGWNSIGYLLNQNISLASAFNPATLPAGDIVLKGEDASAVYYPASGWVGDLETLQIMHGYKLKAESNATLQYNASAVANKSAKLTTTTREVLFNTYDVTPQRFEHSATFIATLVDAGGNNITQKGDVIIAYVGDEARGVTEARQVSELEGSVFILTVFSNRPDELVTLSYKGSGSAQVLTSDVTIPFKEDAVIGTPLQPLQLSEAQFTATSTVQWQQKVLLYPNPVQQQLYISSPIPVQRINIYNALGALVRVTVPTQNAVDINLRQLESGVYTLQLLTTEGILIRKIVKASH